MGEQHEMNQNIFEIPRIVPCDSTPTFPKIQDGFICSYRDYAQDFVGSSDLEAFYRGVETAVNARLADEDAYDVMAVCYPGSVVIGPVALNGAALWPKLFYCEPFGGGERGVKLLMKLHTARFDTPHEGVASVDLHNNSPDKNPIHTRSTIGQFRPVLLEQVRRAHGASGPTWQRGLCATKIVIGQEAIMALDETDDGRLRHALSRVIDMALPPRPVEERNFFKKLIANIAKWQ